MIEDVEMDEWSHKAEQNAERQIRGTSNVGEISKKR